MQEMFVPMVVLQVKEAAKDLIEMKFSSAPKEAVEGEELVFRLMLHYAGKTGIEGQEIPVSIEASVQPGSRCVPPLITHRVYRPLGSKRSAIPFQSGTG